MAEKIAITFDEDNQIRVLESDKFRETDSLKNESIGFISSKSLHPIDLDIYLLTSQKY